MPALRRAGLPDLWAFLAQMTHQPRRIYGAMAAEAASGTLWCVVDGGDVLAIGAVASQPGVLPHEIGLAWGHVRPGSLGHFQGSAIVRAARRALAEELRRFRVVISFVRDGDRTAERIARASGFQPTGNVVSGMREWFIERPTPAHVQDVQIALGRDLRQDGAAPGLAG